MTFDKFEWDEAKNRANLNKHGLDFSDAEEMFRGGFFYEPDTREEYGEKRWTGLGMIRGRISARCLRGAWHGSHSGYITEKGEPA
jgi:uncharacterized DUF497 family protein